MITHIVMIIIIYYWDHLNPPHPHHPLFNTC